MEGDSTQQHTDTHRPITKASPSLNSERNALLKPGKKPSASPYLKASFHHALRTRRRRGRLFRNTFFCLLVFSCKRIEQERLPILFLLALHRNNGNDVEQQHPARLFLWQTLA